MTAYDKTSKQKSGNAAIYTRKARILEDDKELNDNVTQRLICTLIIRFNMECAFSVSLKRYDDTNECEESDDEKNIENRSALQELFEDIRNGLVDTVIVYAMNILSTNLKNVDKIVRFFKEHDVRLILARQGIDSANSDGKSFFQQIGDLIQREYRESLAEERKHLKNQEK